MPIPFVKIKSPEQPTEAAVNTRYDSEPIDWDAMQEQAAKLTAEQAEAGKQVTNHEVALTVPEPTATEMAAFNAIPKDPVLPLPGGLSTPQNKRL